MRKNKNKIKKNIKENKIEEIWGENKFDPNGSYVGVAENKTEPVQDADDL